MRVWYTNADQLLNKRDALDMAICGDEPDMIFITEVLPKVFVSTISPALLALPGYTLFTNFDFNMEHIARRGIRGVCIYIRDHIRATEVSFPSSNFSEQLWIKVELEGNDSLYAGCIYRSPSGDPYQSVSNLSHLLQTVCTMNPSHLLIAGDFNLPQIDWLNNLCQKEDSHFASLFLATVQDTFLVQHVTEPTRFRHGVNPSLLDLILTNEEGMVHHLDYCPGLGKSDHVLIKCQITCYNTTHTSESLRWNFSRADFLKLNQIISRTDWSCLSALEPDLGYLWFMDTFFAQINECIPRARSSYVRKNIYMTSQSLRLKKQKHMLWCVYKHSQDPVDLARFKLCRNKLRSMTRQLRRDFESQLAANIKGNTKN